MISTAPVLRILAASLVLPWLGSSTAAAQSLVNGGVVSGTISSPTQTVSYTFVAGAAGQHGQIQLVDVNLTALYPKVEVYGPLGLVDSDSGETVASVAFQVLNPGTHTVEVSDKSASATGAYDVHFTLAPGANEGGLLPNGGEVTGFIDLGDLDSFTFDASTGATIQLQVADTLFGALVPIVRIYGPSGALVASDWGTTVASIVYQAGADGEHTVVVSDKGFTELGIYDLYFTHAPGAKEGGALVNGASLSGTIDLGDLDSFELPVLAGEQLELEMVEVNTTALTPMIRLYGPAGGLVTSDWGASVATISTTAISSGTYTLVASDRSGTGTGDYGLSYFRDLETYCAAGTTASGCQASISGQGDPSASAGAGFVLTTAGAEGAKDGLFFFGTNGRQASSWGNGTSFQCVVPPVKRGGLLTAVGTSGSCDGSFAQDLNALWCPTCPKPLHNPGAGATVQAQLWYRDPFNTSNQTTSLSDAIEFVVAP
jgi:hypothetical protein